MSEQQQAMSRKRWPLLEAVNMIEMLSYLGTSPLAERQVTDEIEWVITGVWDNTFNGVVRAQLSEAHVDQVIDEVASRFRERNVPHLWFLNGDSRPGNLEQLLLAHGWVCLRVAGEYSPATRFCLYSPPLDSVVWYRVYILLEGGMEMETLSIGQVARRAGVGVETVRFYEREGLLEEPPRRASGYRQYSEQAIKRIHFIKRAQQLGFSLKEITELLMLRVDAQTSCEEVKQRTEAKIAEVERKLVELQSMRQALLQVAALCTGQGPASACPMLDALDQQETLDQVADGEE